MKLTLLTTLTVVLLAFWLPASSQDTSLRAAPPWPPDLANLPEQPLGGGWVPPVRFVAPAGQLGGSTQAVAVQGSLAYIGDGPRMLVLDVAHPDTPVQVGQTPPLTEVVHGHRRCRRPGLRDRG